MPQKFMQHPRPQELGGLSMVLACARMFQQTHGFWAEFHTPLPSENRASPTFQILQG